MRFLLILITVLGLPLAHADTSTALLWDCSADITLQGDGDFFMRYGRDSWAGKGSLICTQGTTTFNKDVTITFNSSGSGYGVNASSILNIHFDIRTETTPANFVFYGYVINRDPVAVIWHNESGVMIVNAKIASTDLTPGILNDLRQGNLFIR